MSETETAPVVESPEAELPLAEFVKRGNLRDRGVEVPELLEAAEPETPAEPVAEPEPEEPKIAASTGQPDKRTRTGRKASIQAEIDELAAKKHAAKSEADAEEARLQRIRAERTALETAPARQAPAEPPPAAPAQPMTQAEYRRFMAMPDAPKPEAFTGENAWQDYQYAVNLFVADKRFDERMARAQQAQRVQQDQVRFSERIATESKTDPEFAKKLDATPMDSRLIPFLHAHPQGPDVMVYLLNHPEEAQRLVTLNLDPSSPHPSAAQIGAIGEIVGTLKVRAEAASRGPARASSISQAKPPIKPLGTSPNVTDDDDGAEEHLPLSEFVRRGNARDPQRNPRAAHR